MYMLLPLPAEGTILRFETCCLDALLISGGVMNFGGDCSDLLQAIGGLHLTGALPTCLLETSSRGVPRASAVGDETNIPSRSAKRPALKGTAGRVFGRINAIEWESIATIFA